MEFKIRLKELRKSKNLTQEELGKLFNVIKQTVSSWENGNSKPDLDSAAQLADFFDVTLDYLLGRDSQEITSSHPDPEVAKLLTDNNIKKISLVQDLSIEEIKKLIELKNTILGDKEKTGH